MTQHRGAHCHSPGWVPMLPVQPWASNRDRPEHLLIPHTKARPLASQEQRYHLCLDDQAACFCTCNRRFRLCTILWS